MKSTGSIRIVSVLMLSFALLLTSCQRILPQLTSGKASATEQPGQVESGTPWVVIQDQSSDGTKVVVEKVISNGLGWVVIHIQDGGKVGPDIGHAAVADGITENLEVKLKEGMATEVMYAMLHIDAGEVGVYEFPGADVPEVGLPEDIFPEFTITVTAGGAVKPLVEVEDQEITDGTVKVSRVVSEVPGWVAVYDDHGGALGYAIGWAAVQAGETLDVIIPVDPNHLKEQMYVKLHIDAGEVDIPELPSDDLPDGADVAVTVDGQEVLVPFRHVIAGAAEAQETAPAEGEGTGEPAATEIAGMDHGQVVVTPGSGPSIQVSDQNVQDGFVEVDEVFSVGAGWVVIYTDDGGEPGEKIGLVAVSNGQNQNVLVQIDTAKATPQLQAILHLDTGQLGVFEFPAADPPILIEIRMVRSVFSTSEQAAEATEETGSDLVVRADDQPIRGGTVTIAEVFSDGPGWIGVHISNPDGSLSHTAAIGAGHLENGLNTNVVIRLTNLARATQTMYAMLHIDAGEIGTYEFPGGPDRPVEAAPVDPFTVLGGLNEQEVTIGVSSAGGTPFLVDGAGYSLYTLSFGECNADCQKEWLPVLATGKLVAGEGVDGQKLSVIGLGSGIRQVTYGNLPLYYFINDFKPGDTNGHGVDGLWFLARP